MRNLEKLRIKKKTIELEGEQYEIEGLSFPELAKFANIMDKKGPEASVNFLLKIPLRKAISKEELPDDKFDEFINTLSAGIATKVINAVKELSGLDQEVPVEKKVD